VSPGHEESRPRQESGPVSSTTQHGTTPDDIAAADRRRQRIKLLLETMIQNRGKVLDLITEASENHDHIALGFKSWSDYVRTEYAGLLARLTVEDRRETVLILSRTGLSTRAIAPIVGTNQSTIARDLQAGDAYASPADEQEIQPADEQEIPWYVRSEEAFVEHFGMRPDIADGLISSGFVTTREEFDEIADKIPNDPAAERTVVGIDGKNYAAPATPRKARRDPLPDSYWRMAHKLMKAVESVEKLHMDDRLPANREALLVRNRFELLQAHKKLTAICADLGVDTGAEPPVCRDCGNKLALGPPSRLREIGGGLR